VGCIIHQTAYTCTARVNTHTHTHRNAHSHTIHFKRELIHNMAWQKGASLLTAVWSESIPLLFCPDVTSYQTDTYVSGQWILAHWVVLPRVTPSTNFLSSSNQWDAECLRCAPELRAAWIWTIQFDTKCLGLFFHADSDRIKFGHSVVNSRINRALMTSFQLTLFHECNFLCVNSDVLLIRITHSLDWFD